MNARERAFAAFQASPGARVEPDHIQQRRTVRARAVPPRQPLPPAGPQPNSRQFARRQAIAARVAPRLAEIDALVPAGDEPSLAERFARAAARFRLEVDAVVDDAADLEEKLERELGEARRVIGDLTSRVLKLEAIAEADAQTAKAIVRLRATRS